MLPFYKGLDRQVLKRIGMTAVKMSAIPGLFEGLTIMVTCRSQDLWQTEWLQPLRIPVWRKLPATRY